MLYYLIDQRSSSVLFGDRNKHVIIGLGSGILDSQVCVTYDFEVSLAITNFVNNPGTQGIQNIQQLKGTAGLALKSRKPDYFELKDRPNIVEKINLLKIRKPAMVTLWESYQAADLQNTHGFFNDVYSIIDPALNDSRRIKEYASIMKITPEFAKQELSMIADSVRVDKFRMFTIYNYWQEKINKCTMENEIEILINTIQQSFWTMGFADE